MISYEETKLHLILDDDERDTLRIILKTFAKQNKDSNIPMTVNYAEKMVKKVREE